MNAVFLMDVSACFIGPVRLVYENTVEEFSLMHYNGPAGKVFAKIMAFYNRRLVGIATKLRRCGRYGENNLHRRYFVKKPFEK